MNNMFHDKIAHLCLTHFSKLPKRGKPQGNEWTILSCIVQENQDHFKVVALGTGTKCIGQNKMSCEGDILNDSHAEIVCRRAFLRYIYTNILKCNTNNGLFKFNKYSNMFQIDPKVKFHFFTTHVPCGDAAIFPKYSSFDISGNLCLKRHLNTVTEDEPHIKKNKIELEDFFRTGAKCLENELNKDLLETGCNYHNTELVRTKPGRGIRTLSVSCSDKIAKWCYLGIQGALLSLILEKPIYLNSFTISGGTAYCKKALNRAFFGRIGDIRLQNPFSANKLIIGQSSLKFNYSKDVLKNPCSSSIVWLDTDETDQIEIAVNGKKQGLTKKQMESKKGRLKICKLELFLNFYNVIKKFQININCDIYRQTKLMAEHYYNSWDIIQNTAFQIWTKKDHKLTNFPLH